MMTVSGKKSVAVLGIRGLPAAHGGFETFAEHLVPKLVEDGWDVTVYCQETGTGPVSSSQYKGATLVHIPVKKDTPLGTIIFDLKSTLHACKHHNLLLTLGYNTGFLAAYCRFKGVYNVINMDGIEWRRSKWSLPVRWWFYINERIACIMGNHLIADHPKIQAHLETRVTSEKITMIPYGANSVREAKVHHIERLGLEAGNYFVVIARIEPENSILTIVEAFSAKNRGYQLVVLGNLFPDSSAYHAKVKQAASDEVIFPGAIYDAEVVSALRFFSRCYIHGHTVGGTNPSLVEALGAGCAVLAHNNQYNRWVTNEQMMYFDNVSDCAVQMERLIENDALTLDLKNTAMEVHQRYFNWAPVLQAYEQLLNDHRQGLVGDEKTV
ncbi:DUF1972 domain-containing protein [Methylophaga lonarensis]|uniref:DUF1972 domain-containing protein n=1 Tax=Methylophaga lonarensis TaxID=999151 RepID=UPI003D282C46